MLAEKDKWHFIPRSTHKKPLLRYQQNGWYKIMGVLRKRYTNLTNQVLR